MPRFSPFAGLRYDPGTASLGEVIAPPYDVVDVAERARLAGRSPYNAILVELPAAAEAGSEDPYAHAARVFTDWQRDGVLSRDDAESFYVYRMRFADEDGTARVTTGVIGALGIDEPGGGEVLPHERTMPKPRGDRLELLRACQANLSPIWGLSLSAGLAEACRAAVGQQPAPLAAADDEGVVHECWPVSSPEHLAPLSELVASSPVVIADGHHRYETAASYRAERRAAAGGAPGGYDALMAYVVELTSEELNVEAIHRLVSGLHGDVEVEDLLAQHFRLKVAPGEAAGVARAMAHTGALGLLRRQDNLLLVPRPELVAEAEADLDSSRLDVALAALPPHDVRYQHGLRNVAAAVESGEAQLGFLLRPASVAQIADTAHSGRRMPPKTTFFRPKPRTGLVFRPLAG